MQLLNKILVNLLKIKIYHQNKKILLDKSSLILCKIVKILIFKIY